MRSSPARPGAGGGRGLRLALRLAIAAGVAGCGASVLVPGTAGGPWCANRVEPAIPPPPASCPAACTGGCQGEQHQICVVDCASGKCGASTVACAPGMRCRVDCNHVGSCQTAKIVCPTDADCEVVCGATSACQMASIQCPTEASCRLACDATSTCQLASMRCGHGSCRSTCGGMSASLGSVDCGGSCDCKSSCDDGGVGMAMAMSPGMGALGGALSADAWLTQTSGQAVVRGASGQITRASFTRCASGQPEGFHGVILASDAAPQLALRVVDDEAGLRAFALGAGVFASPLAQASCRKLSGGVRRAGRAVNKIPLLEGSISLDCSALGGDIVVEAKFANCHRAQGEVAAIQGALQAIDADARARLLAFPAVAAPEAATLRPELSGLRVLLRPSFLSAPGAEQTAAAKREALGAAREFFAGMGWMPVADEAAPRDLDAELAVSGAAFVEVGGVLGLLLPPAARPLLVLTAGGREIVSVAAGPRGLRCETSGTGDERRRRCGELATKASNARIVTALNGSQELADLARKTK